MEDENKRDERKKDRKNLQDTVDIFTLCFERCPDSEHGNMAPGIAFLTR